jgi:signal transduction histidine kinase
VQGGANLDYPRCDPHQLENALLNLALNARDAIPEGGRILVQAESKQAADLDPTLEPGLYAVPAVIDTGSGMTAEHSSHALEPFYTTKGTELGFSAIASRRSRSDCANSTLRSS